MTKKQQGKYKDVQKLAISNYIHIVFINLLGTHTLYTFSNTQT